MSLTPREKDAVIVIAFLAGFALMVLFIYKYIAPAVQHALN